MPTRYYVDPCDNLDTLDPPPPRQRTWLVLDRTRNDSQVAEFNTRQDARNEARRLNGQERARQDPDEIKAREDFWFWEDKE